MALSAVVVVLAVSAVAQISPTSGPYRRTVDRGYAALAQPLVVESDASGAALVSFLHEAGALGRIAFFFDLDTLASDTADLQHRYDAITPPHPTTGSGCATAIAGRASAIATLRSSLEGVVGGRTGLGPVDEAAATASVTSAGAELQSADASWAACRRALRRAPGSARLPASTWVHDPGLFAAAAASHLVSAVAGSHALTPVHSIVVLAVVTDPAAVASGSTLVAPAATTLVAHVVLANQGNVDEHGVEVGGEATLQGASASPVPVQRTVNVAAGRSTTMVLPGLKVVPGSSYTLQVVAESPHSPGTGALSTRTIQVQVQPAATVTSVTSSPLVAVRGRPVTLVADVLSSLAGPASSSRAQIPTGTVTFADDGVTVPGCGAQPVHNRQATCVVTFPAASAHAITAQYSGDARDGGSLSPAITLKVG
jgi:hypothetical protein